MLQFSVFFASDRPKSEMTTMSFRPSESNRNTNQTIKQQHHTPRILPGHDRVTIYDTTTAMNVEINKKSQGEHNVTQ
jgi:hypothetical protein